MTEWISIYEKLPEDGQLVIVYLWRDKIPFCLKYTPSNIDYLLDKYFTLWSPIEMPQIKENVSSDQQPTS